MQSLPQGRINEASKYTVHSSIGSYTLAIATTSATRAMCVRPDNHDHKDARTRRAAGRSKKVRRRGWERRADHGQVIWRDAAAAVGRCL